MIKLLRSTWRNSQSSDTVNPQVDATSSDTPMVPSILAACVAYPTSDAALRMAIREQLNHAEAIVPILVILDDWLVKLSSLGTGLTLDADVAGNDHSVMIPTLSCSGEVEVPPLDKVRQGLLANTRTDSDYKDFGILTSNSRCDIRDATSTRTVPPASSTPCCTPSIRA
jgi:hypothetical protein